MDACIPCIFYAVLNSQQKVLAANNHF